MSRWEMQKDSSSSDDEGQASVWNLVEVSTTSSDDNRSSERYGELTLCISEACIHMILVNLPEIKAYHTIHFIESLL